MSESTVPGGGAERPPAHDEPDATRATGAARGAATTALGALAGAVAGTAAGLGTMIVGPVGAIVGAIVGAELAGVPAQAVAATEAGYTPEHDEHYRSLWESSPGRAADARFESVRSAYQFGHVAAYQPGFVGRDFIAAEGDLRSLWDSDFRARYGEWAGVRSFVCDAYGHSRSENFGLRREAGVIGSGGSAVDPVELARARAGLASNPETPERDEPLFPADLAATSPNAGGVPGAGSLGELPEVPANQAHNERADYH